MKYLGDFDEIHALADVLMNEYSEDEIVQTILNILKDAYIRGRKKVSDDLKWDWTDYYLLNWDEWYQEVILKEIEGKNVIDRIREHVENYDVQRLAVVIDTEYHRDFNTGQDDMAKEIQKESGRPIKKVWYTMLDERVRDTHDYLEGVSVPIDEKFYTYDGDSAESPGNFSLAENNINCRCVIGYKWM